MKFLKKIAPFVIFFAFITTTVGVYKKQNRQVAAAFCCADSGELLYSENANSRVAPASLTKLLTASVALNYISADEVFTVGSEQELVQPGSSLCLISEGQQITLYDLIAGMLMVSGNDAAYTVAVSTARALRPGVTMTNSEAADCFCGLMNGFATEIGMKDSRFVTPDGWDNENQYTTVSDLLVLAKYALSVPEIREIVSTPQRHVVFKSGENITWINSNCLLDPDSPFYSENAFGMKTGTTSKAGNCLIAAFYKNEKTYVSVVTGCKSNSERYELTLDNFMKYA